MPRQQRRAAVELVHWAYGAGGGAAFALLPTGSGAAAGPVRPMVRRRLGFELRLAPALGLSQAKKRAIDRARCAADHLLYGLVLAEMRPAAQENVGDAQAGSVPRRPRARAWCGTVQGVGFRPYAVGLATS